MSKYRHIFDITIILVIITYSYASENNSSGFRLPKSLIPVKYNLRIETNLNDRFTFTTVVDIHIKCIKPTKIITLHSRGLKIYSRNIRLHTWENQFQIVNISTELNYDFLHIHLDKNLRPKRLFKLSIKSSGILHDEMQGYYRASYSDGPNTNKKWFTVTHFEPTYARTVFPCFDEPGFKASFQISMLHDHNLKAIANMPVRTVKESSKKVFDIFEESPPMSTYHVAFMLTDFDFKDTSVSNVSIKVWARRNALPQVQYALDIIPKLLEFYQSYFNTKYSLKKLDLVVLPDFPKEAMENWGLILLRESSLLGNTASLSIFKKEEITSIIAHKLAQQWFGNLVTMKWWRDVWIKEGFAGYFATLAINYLFPEWNYYRFNVLTNIQNVLAADANVYSQPISKVISSAEDIDQYYDIIVYRKAALIIRQLEQQLTAVKFKIAIKTFLTKYKYQSINETELWATLAEYAKSTGMLPKLATYQEMMTPWTLRAGYPLVNVMRNYKDFLVGITQTRYFVNPVLQYDTCYWTPLSFATGIQKNFNSSLANLWLECPKKNITFDAPDLANKWIIFNNQASGLYRVNYDETNWNMLIKQFLDNYEEIDEISRVLIIDDVMKLSITRHVTYDLAFNLIDYIEIEEKYLPWKTAIDNFNIIASYLENSPIYELFKKYIIRILNSAYQQFGRIDMSKEIGESLKFQELLMKTACYYDQQDCMTTTTSIFSRWMMTRNNSIPAHLRGVIYCNGVKYGGENEWNFLWNQYLISENSDEKQEMLTALGCSREVAFLDRIIKLSIEAEYEMNEESIITVFSSVAKNPVGAQIAKEFLYAYIKNNYNQTQPTILVAYTKIIGGALRTNTDITEFKYFIQYYQIPSYLIGQILEEVKFRIMWLETYYNQINQILIAKTSPRPEQTKQRKKKKNDY